MADFTINISYPDEKQAELIECLRDHYGKKEDGSDYTPLELRGLFQSYCVGRLKSIYKKWKLAQNADDLEAY